MRPESKGSLFGQSAEQGTLADAVREDALVEMESAVLAVLQSLADQPQSSSASRLLAAEGQDAFRFVQASRRRYDVVLMNPPFGEPAAGTKDILRSQYPGAPSTSDLSGLFVARGRELCKESGYVGAITSRVCLFIQSFRDWRQQNLLDGSLRVCADLGLGVMEQAMVEAAAYVLAARPSSEPRSVPFLRLLLEEDRHAALGAVTASARNGEEDHRLFRVNVSDFAALPDSPIAYWVDRETVELLTSLFPRSSHPLE